MDVNSRVPSLCYECLCLPENLSDKSTSTTFAVVHRPQNDPKIHDDASSPMVLQELAPSQAQKIKSRGDLESELFGNSDIANLSLSVRSNEGEAAEHGIYYDDTEYDYMQHIRELGDQNDDQSYFIEAQAKRSHKQREGKVRLEDALREASLNDEASGSERETVGSGVSPLLAESSLPSKGLMNNSYQDQQDIPDAIAGFQPDMDLRLREVLEALDDEAYVDNEDEVFGELAKDGRELSLSEFEQLDFAADSNEAEDEGWETDDTAKPDDKSPSSGILPSTTSLTNPDSDIQMEDKPDEGIGDWMKEFNKFQKDQMKKEIKPQNPNAELQSSIVTGNSITGGRKKKRKGAMTSNTGYSMTSSSLARTEGLTLLDARFDKIEEDYANDAMDDGDGSVSVASSTVSQTSQLRSDFDGIMDDFLDGYSTSGRRRVKKGRYQSGMEQLDEIRSGLGPAKTWAEKVR